MPESQQSDEHREEPRVTTIGDRAYRASIEPYSEAPVVTLAPGVVGCTFCGNTKFRRSRVRFPDFKEVLLLRYPLRCMRCNQRQYGLFITAAFALAPKSPSARVARGKETWKAWTDREMNNHPLQRPMTTTVGTRATKLKPTQSTPRSEPASPQPWHDEDRQIW